MLRIHNHKKIDLKVWKKFLQKLKNPKKNIRIGLVGKYIELQDAYKSIHESFLHAGVSNQCEVEVVSIHSEMINDENVSTTFFGLHGVLIAPGFGDRGVDGKIAAIKFIRENNIPFLGICLGMQCAIIEFARNILGYENAHSTEMEPNTPHPVVDIMESQKSITVKGGTMRLGAFDCNLTEGSIAEKSYNKQKIQERHRHRYEFNNVYLEEINKAGLVATGINPESGLVEIVELEGHPWFVGVQFHPELKSRVTQPHPLFVNFIDAAIGYKEKFKK